VTKAIKLTDKEVERQVALLTRGCEALYTQEELCARLRVGAESGRQLRIKYGMDPTAPDIHLGHTVQLRMLRRFQDLGHVVVLIIGDYTARIGDPSGRDAARPVLTPDQVDQNARTYLDQAGLVLDTNPDRLEVRRNSEWFGELSFVDVLKLTGQATVQQMIARENFRKRLDEGREIAVTELLYPLMQAYDSVKIDADVEFGGSDQTFNCLMGRDLMAKGQLPRQVVIITPILVGLDGVEKMSKSKGNYIGLTDEPNDMFGKVMSIPDTLMENYFTLLTDLPAEQIRALTDADQTHPRRAKAALAGMIVESCHGKDQAHAAAAEFDRVFSQRNVPTDMPELALSPGKINIVDLVMTAGFAPSKGAARRLIAQNAVSIDGDKITDIAAAVEPASGQILRVGKRKFARFTVG